MRQRELTHKDSKPLSLAGYTAETRPVQPSSWRENVLLVSGLGLVVLALSMVLTTVLS
jgi:hypothetical protein